VDGILIVTAGVKRVVELVVLACLLTRPQYCEEFHVPFLQPTVAFACLTKQPTSEVVQWAIAHPDWAIKKWTCGPPGA
jgi:hypothetical protein